jgi:hypothetical protein
MDKVESMSPPEFIEGLLPEPVQNEGDLGLHASIVDVRPDPGRGVVNQIIQETIQNAFVVHIKLAQMLAPDVIENVGDVSTTTLKLFRI